MKTFHKGTPDEITHFETSEELAFQQWLSEKPAQYKGDAVAQSAIQWIIDNPHMAVSIATASHAANYFGCACPIHSIALNTAKDMQAGDNRISFNNSLR